MKSTMRRKRIFCSILALVFGLVASNHALAQEEEDVTKGSIKLTTNVEYPMLTLDGDSADAEYEGGSGNVAIIYNVDRTADHTLVVNGGDEYTPITIKIKQKDFKKVRLKTADRSLVYRWRVTKKVRLKKAKKQTKKKEAPKKPEYDPDDED